MKTMKVLFILPLLALLPACAQTKPLEPRDGKAVYSPAAVINSTASPPENRTGSENPPEAFETIDSDKIMKGTIGLVVLSDSYQVGEPIRIYNTDGSVWIEFELSDNNTIEYGANGFKPVILDTDRVDLVLKCTGQDRSRYEVLVNDETGLKKYVKKSDRNLRFETWEAYVVDMFAVSFDEKENPVLESPRGKVKQNMPQPLKEWTLKPVAVRGVWMKIEWDENPSRPGKGKKDSGWIRWRDSEKIIVHLFGMA